MFRDEVPITLDPAIAERVAVLVPQLAGAYVPCPVSDVEDIIHGVLLDMLMKHKVTINGGNTTDAKLRSWIRNVYLRTLRMHIRKRRTVNARGRRHQIAVGADLIGEEKWEQSSGFGLINDMEEVTTEEAAHALHVSRPFLVKLIDTGVLPARKVGRNRRILVSDLMAYREKVFGKAKAACGEVARLAQAEESARHPRQKGGANGD